MAVRRRAKNLLRRRISSGLALFVELAEGVWSAIRFAVTRAAQSDQIRWVIRFGGCVAGLVTAAMVHVQARPMNGAAVRALALLTSNDGEAHHAPTLPAIIRTPAAPVLGCGTMMRSSMGQMAGARTESRRVPAMQRAAFHFVRLQPKRLPALHAGENDRFAPIRIRAAAHLAARKPTRITLSFASMCHLQSNRGAARAHPRAELLPREKATLYQHQGAALPTGSSYPCIFHSFSLSRLPALRGL
jgi:hypothetical protein